MSILGDCDQEHRMEALISCDKVILKLSLYEGSLVSQEAVFPSFVVNVSYWIVKCHGTEYSYHRLKM